MSLFFLYRFQQKFNYCFNSDLLAILNFDLVTNFSRFAQFTIHPSFILLCLFVVIDQLNFHLWFVVTDQLNFHLHFTIP